MDDFSFDLLKSPLYLAGVGVSLVTLAIIRWAELKPEPRSSVPYYDRVRRIHTYLRQTGWRTRVRIGAEPLLNFGQPLTYRLINPKFLLTEVMGKEPFSILPCTAGWLCVLLSEWQLGVELIAGALLWRALWDWIFLPATWSSGEMAKTILLKLAWCLATGIYLASVAYLAVAAVLVILVLFAFLASGATNQRRSKR